MKRYKLLFEAYKVGHITTHSDNTKWKKFGKGDWRQVVDKEKSVTNFDDKSIEKNQKEGPVDKEKEESKEQLQKKAFKPQKHWSTKFVKNIKEYRKQINVKVDEETINRGIDDYIDDHYGGDINIKKKKELQKKIIKEFEIVSEKIKNSPNIVRFHLDDSIIDGFIKDGRTKNLFETNTGYGETDKRSRKKWENNLYDGDQQIKKEITESERPTYGMVLTPEAKKQNKGKEYGSHYFVCKDHVRERTTHTFDDSCVSYSNSSFIEDNLFSICREDDKDASANYRNIKKMIYCNKGDEYIESQIHGQLNLKEDIDYVVFNKKGEEEISLNFKKMCIIHKIICKTPQDKILYDGKGEWK